MKQPLRTGQRGVTLIEVMVGAAVMVAIFTGLLGSFQALLALINTSRSQTGAVAIANAQIEYLRSLPYDSVGTLGGIPAGLIPQTKSVTLNEKTFTQRTLIQYVDALQDGEGVDDENGITADYKRAKVEISWQLKGVTKTFSLITNIVPRGMETLDGGGTLRVNVFDANVTPVAGAAVRIQNFTLSPTVDVTANTNTSGAVLFPGALAGAGYQITVSKTGYSTAGTYSSSAANPDPNPGHVAVIESEVSTMNFAIDEVSSILLTTHGSPTIGTFSDSFDDTNQLALLQNVVVSGGSLMLSAASGNAYATTTAPSPLASWRLARWTDSIPGGTQATYRIYSVDMAGTRTLVPDSDLPGNATGFVNSPVVLSGLDVATYPRLAIGVALLGGTPTIQSWEIEYATAIPAIASVPVRVTGSKTIGTTAASLPIYKFDSTVTTSGGGTYTLSNMEWDTYTMSPIGYDIADSCESVPLSLLPGEGANASLTLVSDTGHSLRVLVVGDDGVAIPDAAVRVFRTGYNQTKGASLCGQSFFGGLSAAADYTVEVTADGYTGETVADVVVSGDTLYTMTLE